MAMIRLILCSTLVAFVLSACGGAARSAKQIYEENAAVLAALRSRANYSGVWNLTLRTKKDTCGLGMSTLPVQAILLQQGKTLKITLSGIKTFKGKLDGKKFSASGSHKVSTTRISGSISGKFKTARTLSLNGSKLGVKSGSTRCAVTFNGSGTKA